MQSESDHRSVFVFGPPPSRDWGEGPMRVSLGPGENSQCSSLVVSAGRGQPTGQGQTTSMSLSVIGIPNFLPKSFSTTTSTSLTILLKLSTLLSAIATLSRSLDR